MKKKTNGMLLTGCISIGIGLVFGVMAAILGAVTAFPGLVENGELKGISPMGSVWSDMVIDSGDWNEFAGEIVSDGADIALTGQEKVKRLMIDCGAAKLSIRTAEDGKLHIKNNGSTKVKYAMDGDVLTLKCKGKRRGSGEIELYVPGEMEFDEVGIELGAGVLDNRTVLRTDRLSLDVGAGEITMADVHADKAELNVGVGQLTMTDTVVGSMDADIAMGEFAYDGEITEGTVEVSMGNAELNLAGSIDAYTCEVPVCAGNITIDDREISAVAYDGTIGNGDNHLRLECAMGNVEVSFQE